jgi:hypothetical protein
VVDQKAPKQSTLLSLFRIAVFVASSQLVPR